MKKLVLAAAILVLLAGLFSFWIVSRPTQAKVSFLNVGQGDAILLQAPSGQRILIDSGPDLSVVSELSHSLPFWAKEIDLAVLSHFHEDHAGGLLSVARHYRIKELAFDEKQASNKKNGELLDAMKQGGTVLSSFQGSKKISLGNDCDLLLASPDHSQSDENDSLVAKFDCLGRSWLFLGDAPKVEQEELRSRFPEWRAGTVKISHHGSDDGLDEEWISQLGAKQGIIEVGQGNRFGHPDRRVLKKLERLGLAVKRTDQDGRMEFAYGP